MSEKAMRLESVQTRVGGLMDEIVSCFKPGVKIAVLVRTPGFPDRDFMMTNDEPSEAIALIQRRAALAKATTEKEWNNG